MGEETGRLVRLTVEADGERETKHVMLREVQTHPVRRKLLHVDFYEVAMDRAVEVEVPVELTGEAAGLLDGGIINLIRRTLGVRCLPGDIPERISVDISSLNVGDALHIEDLVKSVPFELIGEGHFTVVTINAPAVEQVSEAEELEEEGVEVGAETDAKGEEVEG
jgi:large subunit ribosomal protein L25